MARRTRPVTYTKKYAIADGAAHAGNMQEMEGALARLVARAYIADHPELMGTDDRAGQRDGAKSEV